MVYQDLNYLVALVKCVASSVRILHGLPGSYYPAALVKCVASNCRIFNGSSGS